MDAEKQEWEPYRSQKKTERIIGENVRIEDFLEKAQAKNSNNIGRPKWKKVNV